MFRYALVTLVCFAVDTALLYVFTNYVFAGHVSDPEKLAKLISNPLSGLVNYMLCSTPMVFGRQQTKNEGVGFLIFTVIGIGTLGINILCLWLLVDYLHIYYLIANIFAYTAGFLWNFFMRRRLVFMSRPRKGQRS